MNGNKTRMIKCDKCKNDIDKVDYLTKECNFCGYATEDAIEYMEFSENENNKRKIQVCSNCTYTYSISDLIIKDNVPYCPNCNSSNLEELN